MDETIDSGAALPPPVAPVAEESNTHLFLLARLAGGLRRIAQNMGMFTTRGPGAGTLGHVKALMDYLVRSDELDHEETMRLLRAMPAGRDKI